MKIRLLVLFVAAALAACGGGNGDGGSPSVHRFQVVSFGDSLSDVGTYQVAGRPPVGPLAFDGGRYTTNPGAVWTELVARYYGDVLQPAARGGFGQPTVALGGMGYAQGGAWVASPPDDDKEGGASATPVSGQIDAFLARYRTFDSRQLVLLQGGSNDIMNAVLAAADHRIPAEMVPVIVTAGAVDLARQVGRLTQAGAARLLLANVPDIGLTPLAIAHPEVAASLTQMSQLFNDTLASEISRQPKPPHFVFADTQRWFREMLSTYKVLGFRVSNTATACSTPKIVARARAIGLQDLETFLRQNGSSLLCSAATLTEPDADQRYMFADELHPSTRLHELYAQFIQREIDSKGIQ